jgi:hypothetical protein
MGGVVEKWVIPLFVAVLLLSGAVAPTPQPVEPNPTGSWEGVITGREMADGRGCCNEQYVRLVVNDDATWTMTTAGWQAAGSIPSRSDRLVLEGNFISDSPGQTLGPALYQLQPISLWGSEVLTGNASARYNGLHVTTGITLKKVP